MELQKPLDEMEYKTVIHRFEYTVIHKLKDKTRIERAMGTQDKIREITKGGINLTERIRKWRDGRCS